MFLQQPSVYKLKHNEVWNHCSCFHKICIFSHLLHWSSLILEYFHDIQNIKQIFTFWVQENTNQNNKNARLSPDLERILRERAKTKRRAMTNTKNDKYKQKYVKNPHLSPDCGRILWDRKGSKKTDVLQSGWPSALTPFFLTTSL